MDKQRTKKLTILQQIFLAQLLHFHLVLEVPAAQGKEPGQLGFLERNELKTKDSLISDNHKCIVIFTTIKNSFNCTCNLHET